MQTKDFALKLGIKIQGKESNEGYVIRFNNSDDYAKVYSLLSRSELLSLEEDQVILSEHTNIIKYISDEFDLTLAANFDKDSYTLTIKEGED